MAKLALVLRVWGLLSNAPRAIAWHNAFVRVPSSTTFDIHSPEVTGALSRLAGEGSVYLRRVDENGGANGGVWLVCNQASMCRYVAKWRPSSGEKYAHEVDVLRRLLSANPGLATDRNVVVPHASINVRTYHDVPVGDIILCTRAEGKTFSTLIFQYFTGQSITLHRLATVAYNIGREMRMLHERYAQQQHGDLHASNVMVSDQDRIVFIDLETMGPTASPDMPYLLNSLTGLSRAYSPDPTLWWHTHQQITAGYRQR